VRVLDSLEGKYEYGIIEVNFPMKCPPGIAFGAFDLRNRGHGEYGEITCWPNTNKHPLYTGGVDPERRLETDMSSTKLWQQELYVYLQERKRSLGAMIEELDRSGTKFLPREGQYKRNKLGKRVANADIFYDLKPYPEDFGEIQKESQ